MKKEIIASIMFLIIVTLFLCGCGERQSVSGKITNMRYYGVGLDNVCEITFDNMTKYPIQASSIVKYNLQEGMNVTMELEFQTSTYTIVKCFIFK